MRLQPLEEKRRAIIDAIKAAGVRGLSLKEVAEKTRVQPITAKKHLMRLVKEGVVEEARYGYVRVFRMKGA
ncbi:MAG: winged helix-turn-helix transcriptional regulator [Candidatus Bathyarchaeia archaeon]